MEYGEQDCKHNAIVKIEWSQGTGKGIYSIYIVCICPTD